MKMWVAMRALAYRRASTRADIPTMVDGVCDIFHAEAVVTRNERRHGSGGVPTVVPGGC